MNIPFVIDNQQHRMADVLNAVLAGDAGRALNMATAYFIIGGRQLLQPRLQRLGHFRLRIAAAPEMGSGIARLTG